MWQTFKRKFDQVNFSPYTNIGINETATIDSTFVKRPILVIILMASTFYISLVMIIDLVFNSTHENNRDINMFSLMLQSVLFFVKFSLFLFNLEKIKILRDKCNQLQNTLNTEEYQILYKGLKFSNTFRKVQLFIAYFLVGYYFLQPILRAFFAYLYTHQLKFPLAPFPGYYPYDTTELPLFLVSFIISTNYMYFAANSIVAVDFLFFWYLEFCIGCFKILLNKANKFIIQTQNSKDVKDSKDLVKIAWKDFVIFHNEILKIITGINEIFNLITLCQVMTQILLLCLNSYVVVYSSSFIQQAIIAITSFFFMGGLLIYCVGGQLVRNQADTLADELYLLMPWYGLQAQDKRNLLITMTCSQKPAIISAYLFNVDHTLLLWVLQTTGSFTAALVALRK